MSVMPDQNLNPMGCLGRALTFLGIVWIGIVILVSIGVVSDGAVGGGFLAGIGGSIIPGLLLLAAGRGLRRRAKMMEGQPGPVPVAQPPVPEKRVPTSRSEPGTATGPTVKTPPLLPSSEPFPAPQAKPAPRPPEPALPARRDVTRRLEDVIPPLDDDLADKANQSPPIDFKPPPPKTSQELIEEARKKWGRRDKPR